MFTVQYNIKITETFHKHYNDVMFVSWKENDI